MFKEGDRLTASKTKTTLNEKSVGALMKKAAKVLMDAGIENSQAESRHLMCFFLDKDIAEIYANLNEILDDVTAMRYMKAVRKRATHYPLQYIVGYTYFLEYIFQCRENVLIPRYDTEGLVLKAMEMAPARNINVLDLCTGSGCIGISYYLMRKDDGFDDIVTLSDISEDALELAKLNAKKLNASIDIVKSDLFESLADEKGRPIKKYDMILSNPPYIRTADINWLMKDVRDFEPRLALDGSRDGLKFYREIVSRAPEFLTEDGRLIMEIGSEQYMDVADMMRKAGFKGVYKLKDMSGLDRVIYGVL